MVPVMESFRMFARSGGQYLQAIDHFLLRQVTSAKTMLTCHNVFVLVDQAVKQGVKRPDPRKISTLDCGSASRI
jgi:hypothetical protein